MTPQLALLINIICGLIIAKIGYGFAGPLNAENRPILKALISLAIYAITIFTLPFDAQLVFAAFAIGFSIACTRIAIRQTRAQTAAENAIMDDLC